MTDPSNPSGNPSIEIEDDKIREECGVFGVFGVERAASLTRLLPVHGIHKVIRNFN